MGFSPAIVNALRNNRTQQVLDRLHTSARADKYKFMGFIPQNYTYNVKAFFSG